MEPILKTKQFIVLNRTKLIVFLSTMGGLYLLHFILKKWWQKKEEEDKDEKDDTQPKMADIENILEEMPQPVPIDKPSCVDKTISLKDLLGELSEFSDDEEWRELIKSVQKFYDDSNE